MSLFIGYWRPNPENVRANSIEARETGSPVTNETMRQKVLEAREKLPASIKLLGSYTPIRSASNGDVERHPAFWIVECDNAADLAWVNNWYQGFLDFEWLPAASVGATPQEVSATVEETEARAASMR